MGIKANKQIFKELIGDESKSEELLEILEPMIEQKMVLREQKGLEQGLEKGINGVDDICNLTNLRKPGNVIITNCSYHRLQQEEKVWSG